MYDRQAGLKKIFTLDSTLVLSGCFLALNYLKTLSCPEHIMSFLSNTIDICFLRVWSRELTHNPPCFSHARYTELISVCHQVVLTCT